MGESAPANGIYRCVRAFSVVSVRSQGPTTAPASFADSDGLFDGVPASFRLSNSTRNSLLSRPSSGGHLDMVVTCRNPDSTISRTTLKAWLA
jgi:hypothetical protein